jgi:multidrug efflux pump subunit AcrA (membrane-fusion protein)
VKRLAILVALAGCGDAPSCEDAFHKFGKAADISNDEMKAAVAACTKDGYAGDTRRCIAKATSLDELEPCVEKEPGFSRLEKDRRESELLKQRAEKLAEQAMHDAQEAQDQVVRLSKDLTDLGAKVDAAVDALASAQNDADRAAARAKLDELRQQRAALEMRVKAVRDAAERAQRAKGVTISKECLDNPLAAGCN